MCILKLIYLDQHSIVFNLILLLFLSYVELISAPEPPFEPLEVLATPLSISSPAQLPPTTAESKGDKQQEGALKSKVF